MIQIKSQREIELMRKANVLTALTHEYLAGLIQPGIMTKELDEAAEEFIRSRGGIPAFKGYGGFPGSVCISVNDEVVHGIPGTRKLVEGDIVSLDTGAVIGGYYGDAARTHGVGSIDEEASRLIAVTRQSFFEGIKFAKVGNRLSDISHAIQAYVEARGFSVVRDYVGHGIGRELHEDPQIPNYGPAGRGPRLQKGMVLAIEPMINEGRFTVRVLPNHWTVVTMDGKRSAHYENTVAITDGEPDILSMR